MPRDAGCSRIPPSLKNNNNAGGTMMLNAQQDILPLVEQTTKAHRDLAYSAVQGINATAKQIQDAQREQLNKRFTLRTDRTKPFLERQAAVIKPWPRCHKGGSTPKWRWGNTRTCC
jgi:hypothetical protein